VELKYNIITCHRSFDGVWSNVYDIIAAIDGPTVCSTANVASFTAFVFSALGLTNGRLRNSAVAAGIEDIYVGELRLLWRVETHRARSQSILKQVGCRNHWLDKRALRGQRVGVRVTGPVARGRRGGGGGLCAGEPDLDRYPPNAARTFNLGVSKNSLSAGREGRERERERERKERRAFCITTTIFFFS